MIARRFAILCTGMLLCGGVPVRAAEGNQDEQAVLAWVASIGGEVVHDEKSPGRPVVGLKFDESPLTAADLAKLQAFPKLRSLTICHTKTISSGGFAHLQALKELRELEVHCTEFSDADLPFIAGLTKLEVLNLGSTKVTDAGLEHARKLRSLRILSLTFTGITDKGLIWLKDLRELREIYLSYTQVSGPGLAHLGSLETLYLGITNFGDVKIDDSCVPYITHMKGLKNLGIIGTAISEKGEDAILAVLPNLKISGGHRPQSPPLPEGLRK